jgi:replicative DNA helicase
MDFLRINKKTHGNVMTATQEKAKETESVKANKNVSAERAVLAGIYSYGIDAFLDVAPMLTPMSFTDRSNQALYKCFSHLFEDKKLKQLDESSVFSAAKELGFGWLVEKREEINHLNSIFNTHILLENVRMFSAKISRLEVARLLRQQMKEADMSLADVGGDEPIEHILGIAEKCIFDFTSKLTSSSGTDPQRIGVGMREHIMERLDNPTEIIGLPTPWPTYNEAIGGGCRRKAVSMIGSRSGVGKSMLSDNLAKHLAELDVPVLYLDTEMSDEDHWYRLGANYSDVTINEIESGRCGSHHAQRQRVVEALDKIEALPIDYINISGIPFEESLAIIRRWIHKNVGFEDDGRTKDCMIIYDYVKLTNGEDLKIGVQEYQVLGFMMTSLHNLAVRNDVPIFTMIQLNRDGIDKETSDVVSGSDRVMWLTTNFAIFKPKSDEEIQVSDPDEGTHKMVIIKHRHGPGMSRGDYINMKMEGAKARITEGKTKNKLKREREQGVNPKPENISPDTDDIPFGATHINVKAEKE